MATLKPPLPVLSPVPPTTLFSQMNAILSLMTRHHPAIEEVAKTILTLMTRHLPAIEEVVMGVVW